jgi:hypothetical protein
MKSLYLLYIGCLLLYGCKDRGVDTYEIHDVSKKHIFRPEVKGIFSTHDASSMHVEGYLDGEAEIYILSPNFDLGKQFGCIPNQGNKIPSGKVDTYFEYSSHYETGEKPYLYYLPCTAKKGHLKVRVSFSKYLKKG